MGRKIILKFLVFYKKYVSSGKHCKYSPTCSEYMYEKVKKYGVIKGGWMGIKRLVSCW